MLLVKVNATSANVCVGFDVLGLALDIKNEFSFEKCDKFEFVGFEKQYATTKSNMVYKAYLKVFEKLNKKPIPVRIGFKGDIPVSRGLGSSSSLIVAGLFAANEVLNKPLKTEDLYDLACEIEGHPDNVAPAIYGGLVASYKNDNKYKSIIYPVNNNLKFLVIIPPFKLSTHEAREALPKVLPYKDIVNNLSRIVNIPYAFNNGDVKLLKELFNDKVHEPYRGKLIANYNNIKKDLEDINCAFAISGSGSCMLVICEKEDEVKEVLKKYNYEIKAAKLGGGVIMEGEI